MDKDKRNPYSNYSKDIHDKCIEKFKELGSCGKVKQVFPDIPISTLYGWCKPLMNEYSSYKKNNPQLKSRNKMHYQKIVVRNNEPIKEEQSAPQQQPIKKEEGKNKKKIVMICSEDADQVLDVLKGIL